MRAPRSGAMLSAMGCAGYTVVNRSRYPGDEVRSIVCRAMGHAPFPRTVIVQTEAPRSPQAGFTPFDRSAPITLDLESESWYRQHGPSWQEDLFLSAAHEAYHNAHPGQPCPHDRCEVLAERYAHEHLRQLERRTERQRRRTPRR